MRKHIPVYIYTNIYTSVHVYTLHFYVCSLSQGASVDHRSACMSARMRLRDVLIYIYTYTFMHIYMHAYTRSACF